MRADNRRPRTYLQKMNEPNAPPAGAQPQKAALQKPQPQISSSRPSWSVLGTAALMAALFGILAAAVWLVVRTWMSTEGPSIPPVGYVAMALGIVFSLVVGFALMALVFYSSRYGYDERAAEEFHVSNDEDDWDNRDA
jgi:hypothetical protein